MVARGYHPNVMDVPAGRPLRLVFRRDGEEPCADRVVFSNPRMERRLARTGPTIIDIPPLESDARFTCGMGRYHGRLRVLPGRGRRRPGALGGEMVGVALAGLAGLLLLVVSLASASGEAAGFAALILLGDLIALGVALVVNRDARPLARAVNRKQPGGR